MAKVTYSKPAIEASVERLMNWSGSDVFDTRRQLQRDIRNVCTVVSVLMADGAIAVTIESIHRENSII